MDLETIILKNKLHFNLKNYLETSHNSYTTLNEGIEILNKNCTNDNDGIIRKNLLEYFRQQLIKFRSNPYLSSNIYLRVEDLTWNWDKTLMFDINKLVDTSGNDEAIINLQKQLNELQRQISEIRQINLEQNPVLERIEENTS